MDGRKYQRKSGIKRTLVMLLALVMLASVCFPAMRVNAEEGGTTAETQLDAGVYEQLLNKLAEAKKKSDLTAEDIAVLSQEISEAYANETINSDQYAELSEKYTKLTVSVSEPSKSHFKSAASETTSAPSGSDETTSAPSGSEETTTAPSGPEETTTAPSEPKETKDPVQELLDRLLGVTNYKDLRMTEEDKAILSRFSPEQNAALSEHFSTLSDEPTVLLADLSVKQGETATFPNMSRDDYEFQIEKDGQTISSSACGITVTNAGNGNQTIQVVTSSDTPVGTYTIHYGKTEYFLIFPYFDEEGTLTLTVTEGQSTDAPVTENKSMTYEKTVTAKGDGTYDLALTLSGAVGTATNPAKVDIVLVIDKSGSMAGNRLSSAKQAAGTLINALDANQAINASYNIVTFSGDVDYTSNGTKHNMENASQSSGWISAARAINTVDGIRADGGTNYEAGLLQAQAQLGSARTDATKIVVFLTDGEPTLRCSNPYAESWFIGPYYGNGNDDNGGRNLAAAKTAVAGISMNRFYVIGTGGANEDILRDLTNAATQANKKNYYYTSNSTELNKLFADIAADISTFLCENVTITDTLHHHADGELMVKVTDPNTVTVTVYDGDKVVEGPAKTVTLAATETNNFSATLTASYDETTGVLKLDFPDNYKLEPTYTYKLSAVIAPTEKAYEEYRDSGYSDRGETGTGTHSGQFGFHSNDSATVTYTYNGTSGQEFYKHPVVQLNPGKLVITKSITGLSDDALTALQQQLSFDVSITYPGKQAATTEVPLTAFTDSDGDGVYTYEMTGLSPDTAYTVTEKNAAVDNYNVTTKINGTVDDDASTSGTVARGQTVTVAYVNEYTSATAEVSVTKTVSGNMGDPNKEFKFTASLKDASMKGITYVLYQKNDEGKYVEVPGGSGTISDDTYKFTLKHDQKIDFTGVKIGAEMTVTENADGYTASITGANATTAGTATFTVTKDGNTVAFNNTKNANIDTGIVTDSIPYILLLTMAVIGAGVLLNKRRVF